MTADLHYFSGDSAFSLSRLDANTRHIAELERQFVQLPGGNGNMPFHCREGLAFFTPEGEEEQPEGEEEQGPTPKEGSLWAPGLVDRIAFSEVYTQPRISEGCILLPLAGEQADGNEPQEDEDGEDEKTRWAGGVRSVRWESGLPGPCIRKGAIRLPVAESSLAALGGVYAVQPVEEGPWAVVGGAVQVPFATSPSEEAEEEPEQKAKASGGVEDAGEDAEEEDAPAVPGVLKSVSVSGEAKAPALKKGDLVLPLAGYDSAAGVFDRPGLIKSVEMIAGASSPTIKSGVLKIPVSGVELCDTVAPQVGLIRDIQPVDDAAWSISDGSIKVPLAQHNAGVANVAGVLSGVAWTSDATPSIKAGVLQLPRTGGGGGGGTPLTDCVVEDTTDEAGEVDGSVLRLNLAEYDSAAGVPAKAGLVDSITMVSGGSPRIEDGCIVVPTHSFDPQQFNVSEGGLVSLLQAPSGLAGLYDSENNRRLTWAELKDSSLVRLSYSSSTSLGVTVKMFGDYLALYVDRP